MKIMEKNNDARVVCQTLGFSGGTVLPVQHYTWVQLKFRFSVIFIFGVMTTFLMFGLGI